MIIHTKCAQKRNYIASIVHLSTSYANRNV